MEVHTRSIYQLHLLQWPLSSPTPYRRFHSKPATPVARRFNLPSGETQQEVQPLLKFHPLLLQQQPHLPSRTFTNPNNRQVGLTLNRIRRFLLVQPLVRNCNPHRYRCSSHRIKIPVVIVVTSPLLLQCWLALLQLPLAVEPARPLLCRHLNRPRTLL